MELEAKLEEMTKNIRREESPWPPGQRLYYRSNEHGPTFEYAAPHSPAKSVNHKTTTEEEMASLREKVQALEKENQQMKEEMRRISAAALGGSGASSSTAVALGSPSTSSSST